MLIRFYKILFSILVSTICVFNSTYCQTTASVDIPRLKEGKARMSEAMINPELNIGIFKLNYTKGKVSHSYYAVINFETNKLVSTFNVKSWTYPHSSWIKNDSLLYLSKGMFIGRKIIFNLNTGEKIQTKLNFRCDAPEAENGQAIHFGHNDFYCTGGVVYWKNYRMYFDDKTHTLIIDKE